MPSPFPGMDPYLEAPDIWEDFHQNLATEIQRQLAPRLRPRYFAALIPRVTYEEVLIEKIRGVKPDVSIYKASQRPLQGGGVGIASAPVTGRVTLDLPVKDYTVEIREASTKLLVTAIEILSPVNKRRGHEAFDAYRKKRRDLLRTSTHLLEIDLLHSGERPPLETPLPGAPYFVLLHRDEDRPNVGIWPLRVQEPIPVVPVPLLQPDPDVPLDLGVAIHTIYDESAYDMRIVYTQPPPKPDFPPEDAAWIKARVRSGA